MHYRRLGGTGLKVSELCLGAMTFGEADPNSFMHGVGADESTTFDILDAAMDANINFVDTADVYGQDGLSERIFGRWMKERRCRENMVVATKFRFRMEEGPNGTGASRYRILRAAEASLRRMQTDRIDLFQIHMQDVEVSEHEIVRALDDLVRSGKVLYIGCSNYTAYRLMEALWMSDKYQLERFVSLQAQYSLAVRDLEREHTPLCERHQLGILPWSPLAGGFLSGKYERGNQASQGSRFASQRWQATLARFDNERAWATLDTVREIANELETTASSVALAWLLSRPVVNSVIFGARTVDQLKANIAAAQITLSEDQLARLDEVSAIEVGYPYDFCQRIQGRW